MNIHEKRKAFEKLLAGAPEVLFALLTVIFYLILQLKTAEGNITTK